MLAVENVGARGRWLVRSKLSRRLNQAAAALAHPTALCGYSRAMGLACLRGTARWRSLTRVKYLGVYIAQALTPGARRQAILDHHLFLARTFRPGLLRGENLLWSAEAGGHHLAIYLCPALIAPMEGEHELSFRADHHLLCTLTFTFLAGPTLGVAASPAMVIGGVQGVPHTREAMRIAAKANNEIAPAAMLILAARALAEAAGAASVLGVAPERHIAVEFAADEMTIDYARLWTEAGSTERDNGWFSLLRTSPERPLSDIARDRRARTRRKREAKAQLHQAIAQTVRQNLLKT